MLASVVPPRGAQAAAAAARTCCGACGARGGGRERQGRRQHTGARTHTAAARHDARARRASPRLIAAILKRARCTPSLLVRTYGPNSFRASVAGCRDRRRRLPTALLSLSFASASLGGRLLQGYGNYPSDR